MLGIVAGIDRHRKEMKFQLEGNRLSPRVGASTYIALGLVAKEMLMQFDQQLKVNAIKRSLLKYNAGK